MSDPSLPVPPAGTTELGIDIIRVDRIVKALEKHGRRFPLRILTPAEDAYVRDRPENLAGRWAAKEAVSKVLGLGVRGVGWREIEIVRLPTGQPTVRLHDRALRRAQQLGMERIAVSISHEHEYAVAIAFGVRTEGGTFVFPLDVEARLDDRSSSSWRASLACVTWMPMSGPPRWPLAARPGRQSMSRTRAPRGHERGSRPAARRGPRREPAAGP